MTKTAPQESKVERKDFLTARQLASVLQVSESTVRRLARQGTIPSIRLTPRLVRFHLTAVRHALDAASKNRARNDADESAFDDGQLSFDDLMT
jgi:excisionase family DNA binding protein